MSTRSYSILGLAAMLLLQSCVFTRSAARTSGLGVWPPTSAQCVRNDNVPFNSLNVSIGAELTRLFADPACVAQPSCTGWVAHEHRQLNGPVSGQFWMGPTNHLFTIGEQDTIGSDAHSLALAQTPQGKRLYRLTFVQTVIVGPSMGVVQATASYGQCVADIIDTTGRPRPRD
jgi:hypothetical protein